MKSIRRVVDRASRGEPGVPGRRRVPAMPMLLRGGPERIVDALVRNRLVQEGESRRRECTAGEQLSPTEAFFRGRHAQKFDTPKIEEQWTRFVIIGRVEIATVELDAQYRVLKEGAGLVERPELRRIAVRGSEAADYLQGQLTNDVEALEPGAGCYSALLNRKGHLQGDMRVLSLEPDAFSIETDEGALDAVLRHLQMYKIGRDVEVDDVSGESRVLSAIGPGALDVIGCGPLRPEHAHTEHEIGGVTVRAIATDLGVDLVATPAHLEAVARALRDTGAEPVSARAAEIVRVESGRPRFGREMTTATMPAEAGIEERAVSFTKGCYIGQEPVARLHYRGRPNRHLRGLELERPVAEGDPVRLGERELGSVGTAVLSPARGPIALAILRREAEPGAAVEVGDGIPAKVVELPF